jgi:sporulation protein YabP
MAIEKKNEKTEPKGFHNLSLENRSRLSLTGVTDVDSFDERSIILFTQLGELTIQGKDLRINSMSVETGDLSVEGDVWSLVYGDKERKKAPTIFSKLFK